LNVDTFIVVPGDPQQLTQGIQKAISKQKNRFIRLPNLILDRQQCQVLRNEERFSLTPKEFKLLQLLLTHHDQVMSRRTIMQKVWETDYMGDTRTLDVHVRWLREKIEQDPSHPQRLITVRGVGYRFIIEEIE
jgi:two-component system phosphate regulon response regulator PhoB